MFSRRFTPTKPEATSSAPSADIERCTPAQAPKSDEPTQPPDQFEQDLHALRMRLSNAMSAMDDEVSTLEKAPLNLNLKDMAKAAGPSKENPAEEERKLHGTKLVLAGQTAAVHCSTLCRRGHTKLRDLRFPYRDHPRVARFLRLPLWMRLVCIIAVLALVKVAASHAHSDAPARSTSSSPAADTKPPLKRSAAPPSTPAVPAAKATTPPPVGGALFTAGLPAASSGSRVSTADLLVALGSTSQPPGGATPSHPPATAAAKGAPAGKAGSSPAAKAASPPATSAASCKPANKFDTSSEKCDSACAESAKKFHCTLCKCKLCNYCSVQAADAGKQHEPSAGAGAKSGSQSKPQAASKKRK